MSDDAPPRTVTNPSGPSPAGSSPSAATSAASSNGTEPDWTVQVTDLIVDSVDKVKARTTGPVLDITHGSVHAVVALIVMLPVLALSLIGVVRLLDWAIPGDVWFVYAGLGTIFVLLGVALWSRRAPGS